MKTLAYLLALLGIFCGKSPAASADKPNIVFILVDDLRWDALGCSGHPFVRTPHIDRIAREGARFPNAFATTPLCSPSRASFLTGQYAHTHGVRRNNEDSALSHRLITFPLLLQRAGYASAYVGKWHMGKDDSPRPGFDRWVSFKGQGTYGNPTLNVDGTETTTKGYVTDVLTDHAVEFLERPHARPFVLYLSHKAVHSDFTPAERHRTLFANEVIRRAPGAKDTLEGKPVLQRKLSIAVKPGEDPGLEDRVVLNQLRCVVAIDESVGRLFTALEETKALDNTLVIFTSDNGFFWGEHGLGNKMAAYEESIRIPLLMRYPKLIQARTTPAQLVLNVDIAPTLLDLAGVAISNEMQGRSLVPVLKGGPAEWRTAFLAEYFDPPRYPIPGWQAVRGERWKYIHYLELEHMDELYDLQADPFEMKNLIHEPGLETTRDAMKAELARLLKETQADPHTNQPTR